MLKQAVLHMPPWLGSPEHRALALPPFAYKVERVHADWFVVRGPAGEDIYSGIGPVRITPMDWAEERRPED